MGYIVHEAVVMAVEEYDQQPDVEAFRESLPEPWRRLVVGPVQGIVNGTRYFAFLPDGSKEGWSDSDDGDDYRARFIALFEGCKWPQGASVAFGGDARAEGVERVEWIPERSDDE